MDTDLSGQLPSLYLGLSRPGVQRFHSIAPMFPLATNGTSCLFLVTYLSRKVKEKQRARVLEQT